MATRAPALVLARIIAVFITLFTSPLTKFFTNSPGTDEVNSSHGKCVAGSPIGETQRGAKYQNSQMNRAEAASSAEGEVEGGPALHPPIELPACVIGDGFVREGDKKCNHPH